MPSPGGDRYNKRKSLILPRCDIRRHFSAKPCDAPTPQEFEFLHVSSQVDIRVRQSKPFNEQVHPFESFDGDARAKVEASFVSWVVG